MEDDDNTGDDLFPEQDHAGHIVYTEAYSYIFENPNWMTNVLLVMVCQFIPIAGPLTMLGYQFEVIESLHRNPRRTYPDFDFNRFVDYLTRGIWPFLVSLVASFVMVPVIGLFYVVGIMMAVGAGAMGANGPDAAGIAFLVMIPVMFLGIVLLSIILSAVMAPMMLRAGLSQDFASAFDFGFIKDFLSKVWVELILETLFLQFSAILALLVGAAALCIGIYPAMAIVMLAQAHLQYQLYELYLYRGGIPVPLKPRTAPREF